MKTIIILILILSKTLLAAAAIYTLHDLSKHSTQNDCWILIQDKIYDISAYISKHPAPKPILLKYCGKNADHGWLTKDIGKAHSPMALRILKTFEIGTIK